MSSHQLVDHLFRSHAGQLVAWLTRIFGPAHLELAEEVVQEALLKALQQWPYSGVPQNPSGWLFRVARNGALDALRRHASFRARAPEIQRQLERAIASHATEVATIEDDELRMVFMCCHPSLPQDARVALSLKTVSGFGVAEIARAFLLSDQTIAQRLVRAKRLLREQDVTLDLPHGEDLRARIDSVLEVIYLLFNEGYKAHAGEELIRHDVCREALRLGRLVAMSPQLAVSGEADHGPPDAHALVALMAFQAARLPARVDGNGELVLLEDQDRRLWDRQLVALGFAHFERCAEGRRMSSYHVQAAIAAVHAEAERAEDTRWDRILSLYDDLLAINPSPVVRLNRAVALSRVEGPAIALAELRSLEAEPALANYYLLPSVMAELHAELGATEVAARYYLQALARPCTEPERRFLQRRLAKPGAIHDSRPGPCSG
jgi:RNA polymerase sigma-70 factor, ECF subfamily